MQQIPQNKIRQIALKHYNEFINVRTEALRWFKITTYTGNKIKAETEVKEIDQKLLDFITSEIIKVEQQKYPEQDIITFPMTQIINISFNKHPM